MNADFSLDGTLSAGASSSDSWREGMRLPASMRLIVVREQWIRFAS
jgi:hypothetical protein